MSGKVSCTAGRVLYRPTYNFSSVSFRRSALASSSSDIRTVSSSSTALQRTPRRYLKLHHVGARRRLYYTASSPEEPLYNPMEAAILTDAMKHVPTCGFTHAALAQGAQDAGYLAASTNLFPRGAFELVLYHLATQRLALKDSVQFPLPNEQTESQHKTTSVSERVRTLVLARLRANEPIQGQLAEAIALMSLAGNIPASLRELSLLADEMWYLAGDVSVDTSWYTKRGLLAGVYASSEVFMSRDTSSGFKETEAFLDRRLQDVARAGGAAGDVGEWLSFTGAATVNVLRSWGVRI